MVTLGCSRRSEENLNLLRLLKSLKKHKDYKIIIRPHPSAKINEIKKLINDLKFKANIEISEGAKNHLFNYSSNTICITGLSGVYYDLMYLGYKVIFFDNDYTIEQKLPRALPPVKTSYSLEEQIEMLLNYDILKWKQNSNKILMECIGMKMLENKNTSLADDIDNIINN